MNFRTNAAYAMREAKGILSVQLAGVELDREHVVPTSGLSLGKHLRMTVSDTGHGIPGELLDRIFEPYFTTKSAGEGTGLGLTVVHGIVKGHGGAIEVESEINKGTTFHVYLPVIEEETQKERKTSVGATPKGYERILLVGDEAMLLEMGRSILGRLGYRVETRTNPLEAFSLLRGE